LSLREDIEKQEHQNFSKSLSDLMLTGAVNLGAWYAFNKYAGRVEVPNVTTGSLRFIGLQSIGGRPWFEAMGKTADSTANLHEIILNAIKATEEMLKVPRAFSAYNIMSEGYLRNNLAELELTQQMLRGQSQFLRSISNGKIDYRMLEQGLKWKNGKLFNTAGEEVLSNARLMFNYWGMTEDALRDKKIGYISRYAQALYRNRGLKPGPTELLVYGGQKWYQPYMQKANAIVRVGVENYLKLLDDPFEVLLRPIENVFGTSSAIPKFLRKGSEFYNRIGLRNMFGAGGWRVLAEADSTSALLRRHLFRNMLPSAFLFLGAIPLADEILRNTPIIKDTRLGGGIGGFFASLYQDVRKTYANISDALGLTSYAKKQKEQAPGSTSALGLLAFPASLSIAATSAAGIQNLIEKVPVGTSGVAPKYFKNIISSIEASDNLLSKASKALKLNQASRTGAYGITAFAAGALLTLPFWPGVFGSEKSSEELEQIYSGEQLVPIRRGRFWEFGITPYEGDEIKHYAPHWTVRLITDAARKTKFGRFYGDPIGRMLHRIVDPYFLEREMDQERPYVVWGPSEQGLGFLEKVLQPVKEIFKPTIVAHPEALGQEPPGLLKRVGPEVPESLQGTIYETNTRNWVSTPQLPDNLNLYASSTAKSFTDTLGLVGFAYSSLANNVINAGQGLGAEAVYESSGRMFSRQKAFWDQELGGMFGLNEFYRRLNPDREYGPEYISSAIRNTQPSWMPEEFQYGDPYAMPLGEMRVPGRGYEALHPELEGIPYEEYPLVHRLNILQDVARLSPAYYKTLSQVKKIAEAGDLSSDEEQMYRNILARDEEYRNDELNRFDQADDSFFGRYWLGLKKIGRSLPTEHLYPISPAHKFMGPGTPEMDYKSYVLLDSPFKSWSSPISDYIVPTFNRLMDDITLGNYTPPRTTQRRDIETYFQQLQFGKNQLLKEKADALYNQGDIEGANFLRSGIRKSIYDLSPYDDIEDYRNVLLPSTMKYISPMVDITDQGRRSNILRMVDPTSRRILKSQWQVTDLQRAGKLEEADAIMGSLKPNTDVSSDIVLNTFDLPDRDFTGYAPGVDLNAFKVKVANSLGHNIRDFNLWKEDERQARILDMINNGSLAGNDKYEYKPHNRELAKNQLQEYFRKIGATDMQITALPTKGYSTVEFHGRENNNDRIKEAMRQEGMIVY
jgi:hypothetical protein